jgi:hypothetical protein
MYNNEGGCKKNRSEDMPVQENEIAAWPCRRTVCGKVPLKRVEGLEDEGIR